jgi:hypothetical protein
VLTLTMLPVSQQTKKQGYNSPTPPAWKGRDSLELVYHLNERYLNLLSHAAATPEGCDWPAVVDQRELWSALAGEALQRASRFPFVILDVQFSDEKWWKAVVSGGGARLEGASSDRQWPWRERPGSVPVDLMQEMLIFAWHTVKWDQRIARLALGMAPAVAESIGALTPGQLAIISDNYPGALYLRWYNQPDFWCRLLIAARDNDEEILAETHLHAKLLMAGELIPRPK